MMAQIKFNPKLIFSEIKKFTKDSDTSMAARLVGIDDIKEQLQNDLDFLFNSHRLKKWSIKHYKREIHALKLFTDLVPLIIFEGDVGTGKTALAEAIGLIIANKFGYEVQLLKMSTQVRGRGFVGEMGTLLSESFQYMENQAKKASCPTLLVIDEADSILTSRDASGQHHEDKAGVNTVLQHLDNLKQKNIPIAVIAITNRFDALDPAIKRRATANYTFVRPTKEIRKLLFNNFLEDVGFDSKDFDSLSEATKEQNINGENIPYSYADLTLRILIPIIRTSIQNDQKLSMEALVNKIKTVAPSTRMQKI